MWEACFRFYSLRQKTTWSGTGETMIRPFASLAIVTVAALSAGCSADSSSLFGNALTTQAISPAVQSGATPVAGGKVDPVCAALAARIDQLRQDGVTERAEKAAAGKGNTVQVKRASLGQLADLDKANAEFQAKCSTIPRPAPQQAAANVVTPVATAAKPAAAAPAAAAPAQPAAAAPAPVVAPAPKQQ